MQTYTPMDASWAMRHEDSGACSRTYSNGVALYYNMSLKYDANLPFHLIPKVIYWIEIWWQRRPFGYSEFIDWDNLSFVTWCTILLEAAIGCQYTVDTMWDALLHTLVVRSENLNYLAPPINSKQYDHSPLTSVISCAFTLTECFLFFGPLSIMIWLCGKIQAD